MTINSESQKKDVPQKAVLQKVLNSIGRLKSKCDIGTFSWKKYSKKYLFGQSKKKKLHILLSKLNCLLCVDQLICCLMSGAMWSTESHYNHHESGLFSQITNLFCHDVSTLI